VLPWGRKTPVMAYTSNPHIKKARRLAVNDVIYGRLTKAQAARKYGVERSTIGRWLARAHPDHRVFIDTLSSAPKHHPNELKPETVDRIIALRKQLKRCAPVIHAHLQDEGIIVSLSSVARTLKRQKLLRKKKQLSAYMPIPRPIAQAPGTLVQMDTIHFIQADRSRCFIYAVLDIYSRSGYAEYHQSISARTSFEVVLRAQQYFRFTIKTIQTDHGPEFSEKLSHLLKREKIILRHSRIRTPNDNAHVERFIRTIQEECFDGFIPHEETVTQKLKKYLIYYNQQRKHLGLNLQTPASIVAKVLT